MSWGQLLLRRQLGSLRGDKGAMGWGLPTISETLVFAEPRLSPEAQHYCPSKAQAEREWQGAIAAMTQLLSQLLQCPHQIESSCLTPSSEGVEIFPAQGVLISGPLPVLSEPRLLAQLQTWTFTPEHCPLAPLQLLPGDHLTPNRLVPWHPQTVPLLEVDPLLREQFCLVLTPTFSWVGVLVHRSNRLAQFQFSFVPDTVAQVLATLRARVQMTQASQLLEFDDLIQAFPPVEPDYQIPMRFSQRLLQALALLTERATAIGSKSPGPRRTANSLPPHALPGAVETVPPDLTVAPSLRVRLDSSSGVKPSPSRPWTDLEQAEGSCNDMELLKAIAHEVWTPLATIQTFTRSLLKRTDLPSEVTKRLQAIQRECRDQIDRFGLIFRAMEITSTEPRSAPSHLTAVALEQVLQDNIPRWQQQASRRNLSLNVSVPQDLPPVVISDPAMLDQVLTGLINRLSQSLPTQSQIDLQVELAGDQLKLQLRSHSDDFVASPLGVTPTETPMFKAVGQLLMLQPETGGLSLSLPVTKHLFRALGGKLTVRTHHPQGEVLTIFLPLGSEQRAS